MNIGFIGLGTMGKPMAGHLLRAGHRLIVYNRSAARTADWQGNDSVTVVASPAEAAAQSELLFTMLSDDAAVEQVYFGDNGIMAGCRPAKEAAGLLRLVIDCSTIDPNVSIRTAQALEALGVDKLDAPVTGSKPQAEEGVLTFIVGGKRDVFEKVEPILLLMGKKAVYMGGHGAGSIAKLANNMMVATHLVALSESLALLQKAGLDPVKFLEVVAGGGARSGMAEMKGPKIIQADYEPQFMAALMNKDLGLAARLSDALRVPLPAAAAVKQVFQMACNGGHGEEDMSAVYKCYEQWIGTAD
ncbi:NAD(P)-dependent oxidoreductase [Paenibacillus ginsengihumi]|uniref:NAD(P)-dependent oxidoreductase n=1 Tax=Paenibacillus ginsengihumi TaxID=431596 RepID=UPI0003719A21|nr:NAD(P)-dependent oxidoreductase [Paenibacillus ginsengihumi]